MGEPDYKREAQRQWSADPCGAVTAGDALEGTREYYERTERERYSAYAPWMREVIPFAGQAGKRVLEIGPGLGSDHMQFARAGAELYGIDLTPKHLELTRRRFDMDNQVTRLVQGDAEALPFRDDTFDVVYSFGVLHHTPDTQKAVNEAYRVLRAGGMAMVSLYHRDSAFYWIYTLLARGILKGNLVRKGYRRLMSEIEYRSDVSGAAPLVKVYSRRQCRRLFCEYAQVRLRTDHIQPSHVIPGIGNRMQRLRRVMERIGRSFGWYITVFAVK